MIYCLVSFDSRIVLASAFQLFNDPEMIPSTLAQPIEADSWLAALVHYRKVLPGLPETPDGA